LEDRDEVPRGHERFVFLTLGVGELTFLGFSGELLDVRLNGSWRSERGQPLGDLDRQAIAEGPEELIEDGYEPYSRANDSGRNQGSPDHWPTLLADPAFDLRPSAQNAKRGWNL
jgi:hypothetical protein